MPLVNIREVRSWHKVRYGVFSVRGAVLLAAGTPLTKGLAKRLADMKVEWVHVCDRDVPDKRLKTVLKPADRSEILSDIEDAFRRLAEAYAVDLRALAASRAFSASLAYVRDKHFTRTIKDVSAREQVLPASLVGRAQQIAEAATTVDPVAVLPIGSNRSGDSLRADHALDVAILSAMLARDFSYEQEEVVRIALGAMMHDAGWVLFPRHWQSGEPTPDDEEPPSEELLSRARLLHPILGYLMLKEQRAFDLLAAHVAYQHHEHQDGTGFPRGLTGPNRVLSLTEALRAPSRLIHRYANIVAVANAYDHLASAPPFGRGLRPGDALTALEAVATTVLNRVVVERFAVSTPPFPVGSDVWVTSGEHKGYQGAVTAVRHRRIDRPEIRLVFDREGKRIRPIDVDTAATSVGLSVDPPGSGVAALQAAEADALPERDEQGEDE